MCTIFLRNSIITIYGIIMYTVTGFFTQWACHATTSPARPSMANLVAIDGPAGPSMAAMDGPLCRKWSPFEFCYR